MNTESVARRVSVLSPPLLPSPIPVRSWTEDSPTCRHDRPGHMPQLATPPPWIKPQLYLDPSDVLDGRVSRTSLYGEGAEGAPIPATSPFLAHSGASASALTGRRGERRVGKGGGRE